MKRASIAYSPVHTAQEGEIMARGKRGQHEGGKPGEARTVLGRSSCIGPTRSGPTSRAPARSFEAAASFFRPTCADAPSARHHLPPQYYDPPSLQLFPFVPFVPFPMWSTSLPPQRAINMSTRRGKYVTEKSCKCVYPPRPPRVTDTYRLQRARRDHAPRKAGLLILTSPAS